MLRRWLWYWTVVFGILAGLVCYKNVKTCLDKSWHMIVFKTIIETILIALSAFYLPVILVLYVTNWIITSVFKEGEYKTLATAATVVCTIVLSIISTFAMEVLLIGGIFGIGKLTDEFVSFFRARRLKRDRVEIIAEEQARADASASNGVVAS